MIDRVAVLSDVHGVLPALTAVLAEPDVLAAELIVLTGDIAAGPQPVRTLDLLLSLGDRVFWVGGNCERELVAAARGEPVAEPISAWAGTALRSDHVELLDRLPKSVTLDVRGLGEVLFCHATPRDDEEFVLVDSPLERWAEVLDGAPDTVVCGHTHMPFLRLADRRTIVNPGSVGMPYGTTGAHWALLGGADGPAIQLRRTLFDRASAADAIEAECDYPDIAEWTRYILREPVSDAEALAVFSPRSRPAGGALG
ncbi:metallophosphoesterase family protein [Actinophytocola oryzae]|uniref:metallophosphoesterase family protein n=1 Tax=Actinophytocola oryzae TaxID=502181 RepID=UPI00106281F2|nr:metallophosphoesterase family protein [Actinophytocola oryzae]